MDQGEIDQLDSEERSQEPTLSQIMVAIKSCQSSLTTQIKTLWVDFSFLKDVHKLPQCLMLSRGTAQLRMIYPLYLQQFVLYKQNRKHRQLR